MTILLKHIVLGVDVATGECVVWVCCVQLRVQRYGELDWILEVFHLGITDGDVGVRG